MPDPDAGHARYAGECECKQAKVGVKLLAAAGFRNVTNTPLESFEFRLLPGGEETILLQAQYMSRKFVENYPVETGGRGLLFAGSLGGKDTPCDRYSSITDSRVWYSWRVLRLSRPAESNQEFLQSSGRDNREGNSGPEP